VIVSPFQKPFRGTRINPVHPLARGLVEAWIFNEQTGALIFDAAGGRSATIGSSMTWQAGGLQAGGTYDDANNIITGPSHNPAQWPGISVFFAGRLVNPPSGAYPAISYCAPHGESYGNWVLAYEAYEAGGAPVWKPGNNSSALYLTMDISGERTLCGTWARQGMARLYADGREIASGVKSNDWPGYSQPHLINGFYRQGVHRSSAHLYQCLYVYNRELSSLEVQTLNANPYCMFQQDLDIGAFEYVDEGGTYITVTDSGSGADAIGQIAVALGVSDAGSGVDALPGARAVLGVADAGAGADMVSYLHNLLSAITDTGHGTESLGVSAGLAVQDSGVGTDSAGVAVSILVTDTGSGVDAVTLIADVIKRVTDVGSGIDAIGGITVQAGVSDAGQGADTAGVRVSLTVTDLGSAVDLVSTLQAALVTIADAGHGTDTVGPVSVSLAVADYCQGIDVIGAVQALLRVLDAGAGVDIVSSYEPGARIRTITATITAPGMTITVRVPSAAVGILAPGIKTTIT
jgi:hypothetical protein